MKNVYLIRHCSANGQHEDSPLTSTGIRQAQLLKTFFTEKDIIVDRIISSPYLRAIESIKPYAEINNLEISVDNRLKERILSEYPVDDWLEVLEQSFSDLNFRLSGGESGNDAIDRIKSVIDSICSDDTATNTILVSHGNLIALLLNQYDPDFGFDGWRNLSNPDIYLINMEDDSFSVQCLWDN